ncbi:MAG: PKD domain-containing protein [Bacteroidota bacterium]
MIIRYNQGLLKLVSLFTVALLIAFSCNPLPKPDFSYTPTENPEAGEAVQFINDSKGATSFYWDFGDEASSTRKNPEHIFQQAGIFGVELYAINEAGEESVIHSVTIYEPTILGFLVYDSTDESILSGAEVMVYDNESDWENRNEPLIQGFTDNEGTIFFNNLDPIVYHVWAYKEGAGGYWIFGGYTSIIVQNKVNLFNVPCIWFPDEQKAIMSLDLFLDQVGIDSFHKRLTTGLLPGEPHR